MIKTINLKLIILQSISLMFLIHGIKRLHIASQGDKYEAFIAGDFEKFDSLSSVRFSQFLVNEEFWSLWVFIPCIILIGILNWKFKVTIINSILICAIVLSLFPLAFFNDGIIHRNLNYFCGLFAEGYGMAFFIGGTILTIIGLTILWKTILMNKKHSTQQRV